MIGISTAKTGAKRRGFLKKQKARIDLITEKIDRVQFRGKAVNFR